MDNLIEKNDEIIAKTHEYLNKKFNSFTNNFDKVKIAELDYFNICKSGIKSFDNEKIYLDTSSVEQTNIIDESYIITYDNRPSRANMQPTINSVWFAKLKDSPKYILVKDNTKSLLENFVFSTGFLGLQSEDYIVNYLYCLILSNDFNNQKDLLSNGATMQGINNETFAEISVPNITKQQAKDFGKSIDDYVNLILDIKNKNHKLKVIKSQLLQKYFG